MVSIRIYLAINIYEISIVDRDKIIVFTVSGTVSVH